MSAPSGMSLLRRFARLAAHGAQSAATSTTPSMAMPGAPGAAAAWLRPHPAHPEAAGLGGLRLLFMRGVGGAAGGAVGRAALAYSGAGAAAAAAAAGAAGASSSTAVGARRVGMLLAAGVLPRGAAAAASSVAAAGAGAAAGAAVSSVRSCTGGLRQLGGALRAKSTAAAGLGGGGAAAEVAAAAAAAPARAALGYGGEALSAGLSAGTRRALAVWLGLCSVWVYSMVVLGGMTRLTRSGLSMTEWKLAGERPPMTESEWVAEFAKYRSSPEYQKIHRGMSLQEFKFIYWMEYAHRMWGRFLGLAFALPAAAFAARGAINRPLGRRLGLLFFMGGTQGLVGWWMVRSGLEAPEHEWAAPRVSPYRLAAHLVSAFAIYATLVWTTLDLLSPRPATTGAPLSLARATAAARGRLLPLAALIAVTATSGAFVAGLDAGRAYNTWPLMAGRLVPEEYVDPRLGLSPLRNLFENTAAVQFNHRTLAATTLLAVGAAWLRYRGAGQLPRGATAWLHGLAALTAVQFTLGVVTLLQYVPVSLGSAHQANALNLFTAALGLLHATRPPAPASGAAAALAPWITPAAVLAVGCIGYTVVAQSGALTQSGSYSGPKQGAAGAAAATAGR